MIYQWIRKELSNSIIILRSEKICLLTEGKQTQFLKNWYKRFIMIYLSNQEEMEN